MLKKTLILLTILTFTTLPTDLFANESVSNIADKWFTSFSLKISKKYNTNQEITYFKTFSSRINTLLATKELNDSQQKLINDLAKLANEKVFRLKQTKQESIKKYLLHNNELIKDFKHLSYNDDHIFLDD
jgi:hypothetical protein